MGFRKENKSIITAIAKKEFLHILHDPRTLTILFIMPILQLVMFGYALKMEIQEVKIGIVDYANTNESRHLIEQFKGSPFFVPFFYDGPLSEMDELFKSRSANLVMIIPEDFDKQLQRNREIPLSFTIDASDANAATAIRNYCNQVIVDFNQTYNRQLPLPFDITSSILYNPDTKSTYFFVPGIIALLLIMISALLTSITITREKETGTMEQILVSPVKSHQIILGKVLPYILLAILIALVILLTGIFLFKVPFRGNALLLFILSTLYIITALSIGLMISTVIYPLHHHCPEHRIDDFHCGQNPAGGHDGGHDHNPAPNHHVIGIYFPHRLHAQTAPISFLHHTSSLLFAYCPGNNS
ncbi:MAG: ABC transporter permease [Calditrichia bacterium]